MKNRVITLLLTATAACVSRAQDLPGPTANLQTLPSGSYVIPMDNTYQLNASSLFNLKAYGLVVYLLNNNVKIKWVIKSGKIKDDIDFSVMAQPAKPTAVATPALRDFKAGPFVIYASDLAGVDALINAYYSANSLTGNNRPKVFKTTAAVTVDIRYDLTMFKPMAALLDDGGNAAIHVAFMTAAGVPSANYSIQTGGDLNLSCYTFASEPHNSNIGPVTDTILKRIHWFLAGGGNFLAQCAAVPNYENNSLGSFQTTTGITVTNINYGTAVTYSNPDLAFSQMDGNYSGSIIGSVKNWQINGAGKNGEHHHATGTAGNSGYINASVSKHVAGTGGLVFYIGNHNFSTADVQNINGIRMFLNAFLTPALLSCSTPVPVKMMRFSGSVIDNKATLEWQVDENETGERFEVEKSNDGQRFTMTGKLDNTSKAGIEQYKFKKSVELQSKQYYRLRIIDKSGAASYSKTIVLRPQGDHHIHLSILENPVHSSLGFQFYASSAMRNQVAIYNAQGQKVYTTFINCSQGSNSFSINISQLLAQGTYILQLSNQESTEVARFNVN